MKVRMGFVANSSSCSFVCIGVLIREKDLKKHKEAIEEILEEHHFNNYTDNEMGYEPIDGYVFFGQEIANNKNSGSYFKEEEFSLKAINKKLDNILKIFKIKGDKKIITGTRVC